MITIHVFWLIAIFAGGALLALGFAIWIVLWNDRKLKDARRTMFEDFHRRPIAGPREDATVVTRDPDKPRRRSRVSTAHLSQPRRDWNKES